MSPINKPNSVESPKSVHRFKADIAIIRKPILALLLSWTMISCPNSAVSESGRQRVFVEWVYDGDTIRAVADTREKIKVRIIGIDCPESTHNDKCERDERFGKKGCDWQVPRGKKAKRRAIELLAKKNAILECDGKCRSDSYDRALRYVRLPDGSDFGLLMVREGLCEEVSRAFPHSRGAQYRKEQRYAREKKRGIWKD